MPSVFEKSGFRFIYPDNWEADETTNDECLLEVTVRSPNTAFWSLTIYPGSRNLGELVDQVVQAMQAEYPELEREAANGVVESESIGCELSFICLDFTNTAFIHALHRDGCTWLLLSQTEDHELDTVEPVFRAMTLSLLGADASN